MLYKKEKESFKEELEEINEIIRNKKQLTYKEYKVSLVEYETLSSDALQIMTNKLFKISDILIMINNNGTLWESNKCHITPSMQEEILNSMRIEEITN